jgi:hypothetical protein
LKTKTEIEIIKDGIKRGVSVRENRKEGNIHMGKVNKQRMDKETIKTLFKEM